MEGNLCLQMDVIYNQIHVSLFGGDHVPQPHIVKYNLAPPSPYMWIYGAFILT